MKHLASLLILAAAALSACVSQSTYQQEVGKATTYQQLSERLKGELASDQAQITQLQNLVRVSLANTLLFAEGGVQLNAAGEATLARIAPVLKSLSGQKIEIRGFTDNLPIGPELRARFPDNLALSKARAEDVKRVLAAQGVPPAMMVASGLGEAQPVASNDTPQGRARNRRVEIDIASAM
ncbi:MAG TPA: OmpA family protein [Rubrivivax sp.]|nr:OmpA family protein [Rubrivivax sp.]